MPSNITNPQSPTTKPTKPPNSSSRLHMLNDHGIVTHDPAKCYLWTRDEFGFGWRYSSQFPPPNWQGHHHATSR